MSVPALARRATSLACAARLLCAAGLPCAAGLAAAAVLAAGCSPRSDESRPAATGLAPAGASTDAATEAAPAADGPPDAGTRALLERAQALLDAGHYGAVAPSLAALLARRPVPAYAQWLAGSAALERADYPEAVERLADSLQREPRYLPYASGLAYARYRSGDHAGARALYDRILAVAPADHRSLFGLGFLSLDEGDVPAARTFAERALAIEPADGYALQLLATVQFEEGRFGESIATVDRLLAAWPSNVEALWCRAQALEGLGRHEEALAALERHDRFEAATKLAATLARRVQAGEASEALHVQRIRLLLEVGETARARQALEEALGALPGSAKLLRLQVELGAPGAPAAR